MQLKLVSSQFCNKNFESTIYRLIFESLFNFTRFAILPFWIIASWSKRSSQRNIYITLLQSSLLKSPFATKDFLITFPLLLPHLWLFRISLNSYTQIGLFPSRKEFQNLLSWIWGIRKKPRKTVSVNQELCSALLFVSGNMEIFGLFLSMPLTRDLFVNSFLSILIAPSNSETIWLYLIHGKRYQSWWFFYFR